MRAVARFQTSLDRLMSHRDRDVRLQAARCVGRLPGPSVIARLRDLATDPDVEVRREALRTLADRAPLAGRATLRTAFNDEPDVACRRAALAGLAALGDSAVLPAIRRVIRNPDSFIYDPSHRSQCVRHALCCEAVTALASIGDASVVPDLEGLLERHVSAALDDAIIRTLAHLGERGAAAIAALVRVASPARAQSAVRALAEVPDASQTDALAAFLGHADAGVRLAAARALAEAVPSHSALLRRVDDPDPSVRALVAEHAGPTMPSILELLLDDAEPNVACAALGALARLPASALPADAAWRVRRKLRSPHVEVAARAIETIAALDPEAADADLADRLGDPTAPVAVRLTAARLFAAAGEATALTRLAAVLFSPEPTMRHGVLDALLVLARHPKRRDGVLSFLTGVLMREAQEPRRRRQAPTPGRRTAVALTPAAALPSPAVAAAAPEVLADLRRAIAERLGEFAAADVATSLAFVAAERSDTALRQTAAIALARLVESLGDAPKAAYDIAHELVADPDVTLRLAGLRILAAVRDHGHAQAMIAALDADEPMLRALAARWIGEATTPLDTDLIDRLETFLDDRNPAVRLAAMQSLVRRRGDEAAGLVIDAALAAGDESVPAVARCLQSVDADIVHHQLARRLAVASSRDRQLALLRLSDAVLAAVHRRNAA